MWKVQTTAVEKLYLRPYANTWWRGQLPTSRSRYILLGVVDQHDGWRIAIDGELRATELEDGRIVYALTKEADGEGLTKLAYIDHVFIDRQLHALLRHYIYHDRTVWSYLRLPAGGALIVLLAGLIIAIPKDAERMRLRREGRVIEGPEMVSVAEFNRRMKSDGVSFDHFRKSWVNRLCGKGLTQLRIPREMERLHFMIVGDTGAGKSALIRQLLLQVRARGEAAIINDPAMEYLPQFYDQTRGDVVLNPLDSRFPFWTPSMEITNEAEALAIATSMFPEQNEHNRFFVDATREIFAHLICLRPTPEELIKWMCNAEEIDRRLKGTHLAAMIDPHAGPQRAGVLGSLNLAGGALKLLPREKDTSQRWSAVEWAKRRKGFVFITSHATVQERLQPLVSMWLDQLMLRLMNEGHTNKPPVWFVLDEAADLKHLPQMAKALTQNRKSNNPMVLGFQGKDQVEMFYGKLGKTMLAQPIIRIYLKTGEPEAAEWIEKALGQVYVERLRETWTAAPGGQRSLSETIDPPRAEPLVPFSKIMGLSRLQGYLKCGNLVVELSTRYIHPTSRCEKFIERPVHIQRADNVADNSCLRTPDSELQSGNGMFFE